MIAPAPISVSDHFLAAETERTLNDFSFAWEGLKETVHDHGDLLIRALPELGPNLAGWVVRIAIEPSRVEARLDDLWPEYGEQRFRWLIGPGTQPSDLTERLLARGLTVLTEWDGLALTDLEVEFPHNPDIVIEPLHEENVEEFAALFASRGPAVQESQLANARRYLNRPQPEVRISCSRLDSRIAGYTTLRLEPTGVAYLRQAFTAPEFRGRHVYLTGVAHRLAVAREAGCTAAVLQAVAQTSSPILRKYGFRKVSWLRALGHAPES